jgi:hypothetical protein
MGNLERRVERLESASGEDWGLTRLLEWIEAKRNGEPTADADAPKGPLIDCLESMPIFQLSRDGPAPRSAETPEELRATVLSAVA